VIHDELRVTVGPDILIRSQAIDEHCAGFNPRANNASQCVGVSVRNGNKKCSTVLVFNTAKHPLVLYRVSPMVFTPTELALINLNGLVRTAELLRAALKVYRQYLPAEQSPVRDHVTTEVIFVLDWIRLAGSRRRMLYVRYKTSWRVRLLPWNQDPCLMDLDPEHLVPATIL